MNTSLTSKIEKEEHGVLHLRSGFEKYKDFFRNLLLSEYFIVYLIILYVLVLLPFIPNLANPANLSNIASNMWPLLIIAIGQTFVLLVAGIDLSQTAVMGVTSVVGAMFITEKMLPAKFEASIFWGVFLSEHGGPMAGDPWGIPVAVIAMILVGIAIGAVNGFSVTVFRMPPFMVTLISMMFFSAFAIFLTRSENIIYLPEGFTTLGNGTIGNISIPFIIALVVAIIAHFILRYTLLGRWFYSIGINPKTSKISGIPTTKVIVMAYVFSGFCASVAAILYSARLEGGRPTLGGTLLLDIIGANVIGGNSLFGGKGKVLWTLFGVMFFILLSNTLNLFNLSHFTINIVKGSIILVAALFDVIRTKLVSN